MAKIECFSIAGMRLWFFSNDHEPPHFHAKRNGQWEYRVRFLESTGQMLELIWASGKSQMSRTDKKLLKEMVEKHRIEILQEWERKVVVV